MSNYKSMKVDRQQKRNKMRQHFHTITHQFSENSPDQAFNSLLESLSDSLSKKKLAQTADYISKKFTFLDDFQSLSKAITCTVQTNRQASLYATENFALPIIHKSQQGITQLLQNISKISTEDSPHKQNTLSELEENKSIKGKQTQFQNFSLNNLTIQKQQEVNECNSEIMKQKQNQFCDDEEKYNLQKMKEEFGSPEKLEQVKKYCQELKNQTIEEFMSHNLTHQKKKKQGMERMFAIYQTIFNAHISQYFQILCCLPENQRQSENQRTSTGKRSLIKGSSHSQRIKSGSKKGSSGEEDIAFDLTIKTRNSKNAFISSAAKQDSLMYSNMSDFDFHGLSVARKNQSVIANLQQVKDNQKDEFEEVEKDQFKEVEKDEFEEVEKDEFSNCEYQRFKQGQNTNQKNDQDEMIGEDEAENEFSIPSNLSRNKLFQKKQYSHEDIEQNIDHHSESCYADDEEQREVESVRLQKKSMQGKNKKRIGTEMVELKKSQQVRKKNKLFNKINATQEDKLSLSRQNKSSQGNIFSTEVSNYQNKITRLKQAKELKKKKLEQELAKVNFQLKLIHDKEEESNPLQKNNFISRVKISDNQQAKRKAESLVKNLRSQKKNRNLAKIGEFKSLDKNINDYMNELTKLRTENEDKLKQRKKLEILERMKHQEIRKMNERKKIEASQQFVLHLKVPGKERQPTIESPTKQEQQEQQDIVTLTPELANKKAYLNKIRSFSVKKHQKDIYEQVLG